MAETGNRFEGSCHCGAIGFTLRTAQPPELWAVRACQCSFCRSHGARTFADPGGSVSFAVAASSRLNRYRFGLKTADFLVCGACGVYVASVLTSPRGQFATLNINTILEPLAAQDAEPVSYEGESIEQRQARRERRWTPVTQAV
jgi:hypothetical protein